MVHIYGHRLVQPHEGRPPGLGGRNLSGTYMLYLYIYIYIYICSKYIVYSTHIWSTDWSCPMEGGRPGSEGRICQVRIFNVYRYI